MKTIEFKQFTKHPERGIARQHGFQFGKKGPGGDFKTSVFTWATEAECFNSFKLILKMDGANG